MDNILGVNIELVKSEAEKAFNAAKYLCKLKPDILRKQTKLDSEKLPNLQKKYGESFDILRKSFRITFEIISKVTLDNWECKRCDINRRQLLRKKDEHEKELQSLKAELITERKIKEDFDKRVKDEHEKELQSLKAELIKERKIKEDFDKRLLEMKSSVIPGKILEVELSDSCRPTKIAQELTDLYENEWSKAFESLEQNHTFNHEEEKQVTQILLQILHLHKTIMLPKGLKYQILEYRRSRARAIIPHIQESVMIKANEKYPEVMDIINQSSEVEEYTKKCIEVCWLMVVQNPPMVMTTDTPLQFDRSTFTGYLQEGSYVQFMIWPALYLSQGGELLRKGVAQGCATLPTNSIASSSSDA